MTSGVQRRFYTCVECNTDAWSTTNEPACVLCGRPMHLTDGGPSILPPSEPVDETLTAYLTAPLPEEALARSENPANLFGKYVLLRELGRGAMGTVVKSWDTYLSRQVALKFLRTTLSQNLEMEPTERVQSFLREARLAARLSHPNIVHIHEVDRREGRYYISMDFVDGGTLADLIHGAGEAKGGTRFYHEPERFLSLLRTIALAVHHAHAQTPSVVHRDLKPQNVLLDGKSRPVVVDFGLANEVQVDGERSDGVRGTPAYMAPEQALGETMSIDARTDVYALGVILYEMLTGQVPFRGANIPSILRKVVTEAPEPPSLLIARLAKTSATVAACPAALREALGIVCLKALSKKREDRYQTALLFADALLPWIRPAAPAPGPAPSEVHLGKRKTRVALLSLGLFVVVGALAAGRLRSTASTPAAALPPGHEAVLLSSELLAAGKWTALSGVVAELRKRAPDHPRLAEFEQALTGRQEAIEQKRKEWTAVMERLTDGVDVDDLRCTLGEFAEAEEEFLGALRRNADRLGRSLLDDARELSGDGPSDAWLSTEAKERAAALLRRLEHLARIAAAEEFGVDGRSVNEARGLTEKFLAYRGAWSLRVNVDPYAEVRILRQGRECARDFTPALLKSLELDAGAVEVELFWPSAADPKRRWSAPLRDLRPGQRVVVSGSLERMDIRIDRQ